MGFIKGNEPHPSQPCPKVRTGICPSEWGCAEDGGGGAIYNTALTLGPTKADSQGPSFQQEPWESGAWSGVERHLVSTRGKTGPSGNRLNGPGRQAKFRGGVTPYYIERQ